MGRRVAVRRGAGGDRVPRIHGIRPWLAGAGPADPGGAEPRARVRHRPADDHRGAYRPAGWSAGAGGFAVAFAAIGYSRSNLFGPRKPFRVYAWCLVYLGMAVSTLVLVRDAENGREWFLIGLLATFATDTGAYAVGRAIGRHKLAPKISPEARPARVRLAVTSRARPRSSPSTRRSIPAYGAGTVWHLAIALPVAAIAGDLFESWMKRRMGVKDAVGSAAGPRRLHRPARFGDLRLSARAGLPAPARALTRGGTDRREPNAWITAYGPAAVGHHYANINGIRMHYVEAGAGEPVVLLHGFPEFWYSWRHQVEALAPGFRLIVPDQRGYNETETRGPYGVATLQADVVGPDRPPRRWSGHTSWGTTGAARSGGCWRCTGLRGWPRWRF